LGKGHLFDLVNLRVYLLPLLLPLLMLWAVYLIYKLVAGIYISN